MATSQQRHKTLSNESNGNYIHDLTAPKRYSASGLVEMAQPDTACPDDADDRERFYAIAQIDGVQSTGPRAEDARDVRRVCYATESLEYAVEIVFINRATDFDEIPRTKDLPLDAPDVGEMSPSTRQHYEHAVARHPEVSD